MQVKWKPVSRSIAANTGLAGWLAADAVRAIILTRDLATDWIDLAAGLAFLIAAAFVLARPPPVAQNTDLGAIAVALAGTLLPVTLAWLARDQRPTSFLLVIQGAAVLIMAASLLYLGRNFSIVPQYRSLITYGPYAFVRHPIYASYIVFDGALVLESHSLLATAIWLAETGLLLIRAQYEEQLLTNSNPEYGRYTARVRWRFVPGIT
jgi:protein-S-isoprenylcysteine O-methyltransferase Ste14